MVKRLAIKRKMSFFIGLLSTFIIGGGLAFAFCGALSLKFGWDFGVDAPKYILERLHLNAIIMGLSALTIGLITLAFLTVVYIHKTSSSQWESKPVKFYMKTEN